MSEHVKKTYLLVIFVLPMIILILLLIIGGEDTHDHKVEVFDQIYIPSMVLEVDIAFYCTVEGPPPEKMEKDWIGTVQFLNVKVNKVSKELNIEETNILDIWYSVDVNIVSFERIQFPDLDQGSELFRCMPEGFEYDQVVQDFMAYRVMRDLLRSDNVDLERIRDVSHSVIIWYIKTELKRLGRIIGLVYRGQVLNYNKPTPTLWLN
ncbi:MAG: hypothetical protein KatS3mg085_473 [Candidatus Dojkabacteria bacterium]|nr:MAG: hypothetical protein KatS3mg085_473 [Candidatus Dojkabacteria bacterium]